MKIKYASIYLTRNDQELKLILADLNKLVKLSLCTVC